MKFNHCFIIRSRLQISTTLGGGGIMISCDDIFTEGVQLCETLQSRCCGPAGPEAVVVVKGV